MYRDLYFEMEGMCRRQNFNKVFFVKLWICEKHICLYVAQLSRFKPLTSHELISYLSFLGYEFTHKLRSIRWVTKELSCGEQTSWVSNVESEM